MSSNTIEKILKFYSIFLYSVVTILGFIITPLFLSPFSIMSYVYWVTFLGIAFGIFFKSAKDHKIFKKVLMVWGLGAFLSILLAFVLILLM